MDLGLGAFGRSLAWRDRETLDEWTAFDGPGVGLGRKVSVES